VQTGGVHDEVNHAWRFTRGYVKGLLAAPEDREPAVRKVIEAAGGKVLNFYFMTGEIDVART
jgi:uncharacterized protein with GYD domain